MLRTQNIVNLQEMFYTFCGGTPIGVGVQQSAFLAWEGYRCWAGSQHFTNLYQLEGVRWEGGLAGIRNNCHVQAISPLNF